MKLIIFLFYISVSVPLLGQEIFFSGKIIYKFEFTNTDTGEDITNDLAPYLGREQHYYINNENYKSYNEKGVLTQLYNSKSNMYYFVNPTTQDVIELDAKENASKILEIEMLIGNDSIAGFNCRKMRVKTNKDEIIYWYSSLLKVPYQNYSKHVFGNWGAYLKATNGALPLKYIAKSSLYTMTATTENVENFKLTEIDFDIKSMLSKD